VSDLRHQLHALADRVDDLDPAARVGELEALRVAALQAAFTAAPTAVEPDDHLLDVDTAAARLAVSRDWLRRRSTLPFVVKLSDGVVRYSSRGLAAYIAQHTAR
jgi:hypothetical protein